MVDCSDENYLTAYDTLCNELENYSDELMEKPRIVLCNKIDMPGAAEHAYEIAARIHESEPETDVIPVSVMTGLGMKDAQKQILTLVNKLEKRNEAESEKKEEAFGSSFMNSRAVIDEFEEENIQYPGSEN